jgi:hypothetical protein
MDTLLVESAKTHLVDLPFRVRYNHDVFKPVGIFEFECSAKIFGVALGAVLHLGADGVCFVPDLEPSFGLLLVHTADHLKEKQRGKGWIKPL